MMRRTAASKREDPYMPRQETDPDLSILMVNWNTCAMTMSCLRTVVDHTLATRHEIILVDNGSNDGSAAAISSAFPTVRVLAENANHGFAKGNNIAAARARGRYLLLLNTDTLLHDAAIDSLMALARQHPEAGIWGGRTMFADGRLNPTSAWGRITAWSAVSFAVGLRGLMPRSPLFNSEGIGGWQRDCPREVDIVSGCFLLIDHDLWKRLGGFDQRFFMYGEEADLCARARALGARPMVSPEATIVHHGGASTVHHANKIAYVMGARIGLIQRHLDGSARIIGHAASIFHVALRALAFRMLAKLKPRRFGALAHEWGTAWAMRSRWMNGPSPGELHCDP